MYLDPQHWWKPKLYSFSILKVYKTGVECWWCMVWCGNYPGQLVGVTCRQQLKGRSNRKDIPSISTICPRLPGYGGRWGGGRGGGVSYPLISCTILSLAASQERYNIYNIIFLSFFDFISLKGVCHEIFDLQFFS